MKGPFALALGAALVLAAFSAAQSMAQEARPDGGTLVSTRCTVCHDTKRICRSLGVRDRVAWFDTASRMVKNGAKLNPGEVEAVAAHLASLPKSDKGLCP